MGDNFGFSWVRENAQKIKATVTISNTYINALYQEVVKSQKTKVDTCGFFKGETPIQYIENNYKPNIVEHLKEFFFTHCILNHLSESLNQKKIVIAGEPKLIDIVLNPNEEAQFIFQLSSVSFENEDRWTRLSLKAPERKNYKDLDRQVESFIKEETNNYKTYTNDEISYNDWVCFQLSVVDEKNNPILRNYRDELWVKISDEESDKELSLLFFGKKKNDTFFSKSVFLQDYLYSQLDVNYNFLIHIVDFIPHTFFSFDLLKHHFQLKNPKEMHQKLIEVFSHRNDLSQRRETIEATLKLLVKHYFIPLPNSLLERQKQLVLSAVHENPDYNVYKAQNDFKEKIKLLAEKQLKETIIIDSISYQLGIKINHEDLSSYLNLLNRPRTKEFVYFDIPSTKIRGQEMPIASSILKIYCLREKTLNYLIGYMTKK